MLVGSQLCRVYIQSAKSSHSLVSQCLWWTSDMWGMIFSLQPVLLLPVDTCCPLSGAPVPLSSVPSVQVDLDSAPASPPSFLWSREVAVPAHQAAMPARLQGLKDDSFFFFSRLELLSNFYSLLLHLDVGFIEYLDCNS